jgi:hypothetical protein
MGQPIELSTTVLGDVLLADTDRSVTGQDGTAYASGEEAAADERFPGRLAAALFEIDAAVDSVFVASNQVVARRGGGWDDAAVGAVTRLIEDFFIFYR